MASPKNECLSAMQNQYAICHYLTRRWGAKPKQIGGYRHFAIDLYLFKVDKRSARVVRNPRTGEKLNVPAKKVVKFKAAPALNKGL